MNQLNILLATVALLLSAQTLKSFAQDASSAATATATATNIQHQDPSQDPVLFQAAASSNSLSGVDEGKKWEEWTNSVYFVPSFDPEIISIPDVQQEFVKNMVHNDNILFREILQEAIDKRNKFAPAVSLMFKYTGKLMGNFIRNRKAEQRLSSRIEPKPAFFEMVAKLAEQVLDASETLKKDKGYTKNSIDVDDFQRRVHAIFDYIERMVNVSPIGAYFKWEEVILFKNDLSNPQHDTHILDEAIELTAQFRALGYEKCIFVARRIINLLRMFSRGLIPSESEV